MTNEQVFAMSFAKIYGLLLDKALDKVLRSPKKEARP